MPRYSVFELSGDLDAIETGLPLEQAFSMVCRLAGFKPRFVQDAGRTVLHFTDNTQMGRELPCIGDGNEPPFLSAQSLMEDVLANGVWGYFAVTDLEFLHKQDRHREERAATLIQNRSPSVSALPDRVTPFARYARGTFTGFAEAAESRS